VKGRSSARRARDRRDVRDVLEGRDVQDLREKWELRHLRDTSEECGVADESGLLFPPSRFFRLFRILDASRARACP